MLKVSIPVAFAADTDESPVYTKKIMDSTTTSPEMMDNETVDSYAIKKDKKL
ncbi:MAG: hypothetical protein LBP35_01940 [Candidatus Ancillula trichonymphae]|nr:hypothetical protein [Candidatus Ancillula trichonymphae]